VVTYKKSIVAEAVAEMALEDIILETDCPYLTPVPYRGRRNESAYVGYVCQKIAQIKGLSDEEVARVTTANARRMFLE
jgi:TatD DNase family protein